MGENQISEPIQYCSYFDHRYLARALALYDSLCINSPPFVWHVLALSEPCERILEKLNLPGLIVTPLATLEAANPSLLNAKQNRNLVEYYFTLTSAYCVFLITQMPKGSLLTYLDSDLYFFDSPQPILDELENASVGIIEHRFSEPNHDMVKHGRFNVGWVSFRNDEYGLECVHDWHTKCLDWCYDRIEGERFADQKYLDRWPKDFSRVHIVENHGANIGPWNVADFVVANHCDQGDATNKPHLVFAHFQGVRYLGFRTYAIAMDAYNIDLKYRKEIFRTIYRPYLKMLLSQQRRLASILSDEKYAVDKELRSPKSLIPIHNFFELIRLPKQYVYMRRRYCWVTV